MNSISFDVTPTEAGEIFAYRHEETEPVPQRRPCSRRAWARGISRYTGRRHSAGKLARDNSPRDNES